jgi:hypothetical protein
MMTQYERVMTARLHAQRKAASYCLSPRREALAHAVVELRLARVQRIAGNPRGAVALTLRRAAHARRVYAGMEDVA